MTNNIEEIMSALREFVEIYLPKSLEKVRKNSEIIALPPKKTELSDVLRTDCFPFVQINLDDVQLEASGSCTQRATMGISINISIKESRPAKRLAVCMRYMDALIDLFGQNPTILGLCDQAQLESLDKALLPDDEIGFVISTLKITTEIA